MSPAATALVTLAAFLLLGGCHQAAPRSRPDSLSRVLAADALLPSPRLIVGRVVAVDAARSFAILELIGDAPAPASSDGAELMTRTASLKETARLRVTRQLRGHTLGTKIITGQPAPGDEVVWLAP